MLSWISEKRRDFSSEEVSECVSVLLLLCFGVQGAPKIHLEVGVSSLKFSN